MRKMFTATDYMLLVSKLTCTPAKAKAKANSNGDYRESAQIQQHDRENDLNIY